MSYSDVNQKPHTDGSREVFARKELKKTKQKQRPNRFLCDFQPDN